MNEPQFLSEPETWWVVFFGVTAVIGLLIGWVLVGAWHEGRAEALGEAEELECGQVIVPVVEQAWPDGHRWIRVSPWNLRACRELVALGAWRVADRSDPQSDWAEC